tara:strand:+ start:2377 stop:4395 length:2019 start_codon:yes stop_codon:yes gene_type:complete
MGGAAGHMSHPFDLNSVDTGNDLLDFFEKAKKFVEKEAAGAVKIDGVNVSFKVVEHNGVHQFAVDRGSMKEIDISGITMDRVDQRFPEGHGMRPAIKTLLMILNKSLRNIKDELEILGMWDDATLFLNTEYVAGTTNVTKYDENFLAIHGMNQFYQRTAKSGASKGNVRPGAERPDGLKAPSSEVLYDPKVMTKLIKKLNVVANEYGFQVYGSVPTQRLEGTDIDFSSTLSQPFTVQVSDDREITKSLKDWLSEASNPRYKTVKLKNGKKTHPLHKELYKAILGGSPAIVDLIEDADAEAAIYGAIFMHATRMLGNDVLRGLTSPMGNVMDHEGVVLRDDKLFGMNPVKITGEFILGGMGSAFQDDTSLNEDEEDFVGYEHKPVKEDEDADPVVDADYTGETIAFVPGAFKPPHMGHLKMVEQYAKRSDIDRVIILISSPKKKNRTLDDGTVVKATHAEDVWKLLLTSAGLADNPKVDLRISKEPSPIGGTLDMIGKNGILKAGDKVILGASDKPVDEGSDIPDWHRWLFVSDKDVKEGVEVMDLESNAVKAFNRQGGTAFRATDMRDLISKAQTDIKAIDELEEFVGEENVFELLAIFGMGPRQSEVNEATVSAAVQGAPAVKPNFPGLDVPDENAEQEKQSRLKTNKTENVDLSMLDEVMKLIIGKGISQ